MKNDGLSMTCNVQERREIVRLKIGERVEAAWAEPASGSGWCNWPVRYLVTGVDGKLRIECLQPDQQSAEILHLYAVAAETHKALTRAVVSLVGGSLST